jgi:hypothetical protein
MTDKCEHRTCHCPARMDNEYCSDYCATAIDDFETGCRCSHPECASVYTEAIPAINEIAFISGITI